MTELPSAGAAVLRVLQTAEPSAKVMAARWAARQWRLGRLTHEFCESMPDMPARPDRPVLMRPRDMPRRGKGTSVPRRLALIHALPRARSNSELAGELSVSLNTVKTQLRGLYRKLGVGTREEALTALAALGVMSPPSRYDEPIAPEPFG